MLFFAKLHFIDWIFTSSCYPKKIERNSKFSSFLYPLEWDINIDDLETTKYITIQEYPEKNKKNYDDIITTELSDLYNKIKEIRVNSVFQYHSQNNKYDYQFYRIK